MNEDKYLVEIEKTYQTICANFDEIFERKTTEEVRSIMDQFLSGDTGNTEVEKFGGKTNAVPASSDAVENAFNDLLSQ